MERNAHPHLRMFPPARRERDRAAGTDPTWSGASRPSLIRFDLVRRRVLGRFVFRQQGQEVRGRDRRHGRTREVRDVASDDVITFRGFGQAGHHGIFKVGQGQLAGTAEDGLVGHSDFEMSQQPIDGLVGFGGAGGFGEDVVKRGHRVAGQDDGEFAGACAAQDLGGIR